MICNESPVAYKSLSLEASLFLSLSLVLSLHIRNTDTRRGFVATGHTLISEYRHQPTVAAWGSITQHLMDFSAYPATDFPLKPAINSIFDRENNSLSIGGKAEQLVLHINWIKLHSLMPKMNNVTFFCTF